MNRPVAVIVTARNAADTIGDAVISALDQDEVGEVIVVDDASTDSTGQASRAAAGADRRFLLLRQDNNTGPAAARNLAIARATAPYIAILDADDWFLPGRFKPLFAEPGWDLIADNIVFISGSVDAGPLPRGAANGQMLDLAAFVRGNVAQRGVQRGELGFLKPVIRRSALPQSDAVYDPALWLGEDYDLYVRMMLSGARFRLSGQVGYAARERAGSLSGRHRTADLWALLQATERHMAMAGRDHPAHAAMLDHHRQLRERWLLRAFLDCKAAKGAGAAIAFALAPPANLLPISRGILTDKTAAFRRRTREAPGFRTLLPLYEASSAGNIPAAQAPAASSAVNSRR